MDHDEYERECEEIRKQNEKYIDMFEAHLKKNGLSEKTIYTHVRNAYFYIDEYLLREEPRPMSDGWLHANDFFGYFFIRKCMWSTPGTIKSTAASLKKFYKCMFEHNEIEKHEYESLCATIKDNMNEWQEDCRQFNDPNAPDPLSGFDLW